MAAASTPIMKGMNDGEKINQFIDRKIKPDTGYLERCNQVIDKLVRHLEKPEDGDKLVIDPDNRKRNVKRILKSGSLGKATAVREMSDIDLIIFFNGFSSVREMSRGMDQYKERMKAHVERLKTTAAWAMNLKFHKMTPYSVQFSLKMSDGQIHEVDLLPAVDITETMAKGDIYQEMKREEDIRGFYSSCLSPLQKLFVTFVPAKLKDFIRLLKYWAKVENVPLLSYFIELLVIDYWRANGKPDNFKTDVYFRHIMERLVHLKSLAVSFNDNYNYRQYRSDLSRPYVLDPANPYKNPAPSIRDVDEVVRKATKVIERLG